MPKAHSFPWLTCNTAWEMSLANIDRCLQSFVQGWYLRHKALSATYYPWNKKRYLKKKKLYFNAEDITSFNNEYKFPETDNNFTNLTKCTSFESEIRVNFLKTKNWAVIWSNQEASSPFSLSAKNVWEEFFPVGRILGSVVLIGRNWCFR